MLCKLAGCFCYDHRWMGNDVPKSSDTYQIIPILWYACKLKITILFTPLRLHITEIVICLAKYFAISQYIYCLVLCRTCNASYVSKFTPGFRYEHWYLINGLISRYLWLKRMTLKNSSVYFSCEFFQMFWFYSCLKILHLLKVKYCTFCISSVPAWMKNWNNLGIAIDT